MPDLGTFARETERSVIVPPYAALVAMQRNRARRRTVTMVGLMVALLLAAAATASLQLRKAADSLPARPVTTPTSGPVPAWPADEIVGYPGAFVTAQLSSASDHSVTLTVWKRCVVPAPDHDCVGAEAMSVVDGEGHRMLALGAVTGSSAQPSLGDSGVLREVAPGVWYWAHLRPGPYLLSATGSDHSMTLTVMDRPVPPRFGTATVECADGTGHCIVDVAARTVQRVQLPELGDVRWAYPTTCGFWGLMGAGGDLRLVIQQPDDSFATVDLSEKPIATSLAEGGRDCEIGVYQGVALMKPQVVVSLDHGRTWQVRRPPDPHGGPLEEYPHLRMVLPPDWAAWPTTTSPFGVPGPLTPLR